MAPFLLARRHDQPTISALPGLTGPPRGLWTKYGNTGKVDPRPTEFSRRTRMRCRGHELHRVAINPVAEEGALASAPGEFLVCRETASQRANGGKWQCT